VTAEPFVDAIPQIPHTAGQCRGASNEGLPSTPSGGELDPQTHAFVCATAAITSIAFTISVLNVLAVVLSNVLN